jgi:hypothetical protein
MASLVPLAILGFTGRSFLNLKADIGRNKLSGGSMNFCICRQMILDSALCMPFESSPKGSVQMLGYQAFRRVLYASSALHFPPTNREHEKP